MIIAELEITEMPHDCWDCPLFELRTSDYGRCSVTDIAYTSEDVDEMGGRPIGDCPLRDAPDKMP